MPLEDIPPSMTAYEIASLSKLDDITTYIQFFVFSGMILLSCFCAWWFVRAVVFKNIRSYIKFNIH